jgi:hypothetical protein
MRCFVLISSVLFSFFANGQALKEKRITLCNTKLQSFVAGTKGFYALRFEVSDIEGLQVSPDPPTDLGKNLVYNNSFSMDYLGHRYLFEKNYGRFPDSSFYEWLDSFRIKNCEYHSFKGTIYPDTVHLFRSVYCPQEEKEEDHIFFKVPNEAAFIGGPAQFNVVLKKRLDSVGFNNLFKEDTAIFLRVLIWPDGVAHEVRKMNFEALQNKTERTIEKVLLHSREWKPAMAGGQVVKSWLQIFVRFRKDGHIEADYFH